MDKKTRSEIARELGSRGGKKLLKTRGKKYYKELARKRWEKEKLKKQE